ncbi:hypothetical protein [Pseudonocardia kunmingensis]|uniref:Uncharacterized protein n=1 Tax=Pseudonocardia kunmingensis TaxID=630975 RepID=A0A543CX45_9PSEU|nr:hypothetical protein [Pseudonocardia kunmingensis]TQM01684.1 hypothetical protein FB558_8585 [Pseudonocardia kunmingensis]
MRREPAEPTSLETPSLDTADMVYALFEAVAQERGMDVESAPTVILTEALPTLTRAVHDLTRRCADETELCWLAAALAALSHHAQALSLPPVPAGTDRIAPR